MKKFYPILGHIVLGGTLAGVLVAGCATAAPRTTEPLVQARAAIEQAERAGAGEYAPEFLNAARAKLARADEDARTSGKVGHADRLADEAQADAQLAAARARAKKAELAASEVAKGVDALKVETDRPTT